MSSTLETGRFVPLENWYPQYHTLWKAIRDPYLVTRRRGIVIHHSAGSRPDGDALLYAKSIVRYHWNKTGSSGKPWRRPLGYQEMIGVDGISREGSGLDYRGIHSGTFEANRDYIAICFEGNYMSKLPNDDMLETAVLRVAEITAQIDWYGDGPLFAGHRDLSPSFTSCPGDRLYSGVPGVLFDEGAITWPNLIHKGDKDEAVPVMKGLIVAAGFPTYTETYSLWWERRVKQFQESAGLTPDGVVGPQTREALRKTILDLLPEA